ncbi:permease [Anoxynatronum sibiricum]|uniref:Permease n=2 Tax=Anoxynatronum sibiricum TaxID=210623 RepID=A0ABU9VPX0_9CLOT
MQQLLLYFFTFLILIISYGKNPDKTRLALKKAWRSFENILPQFIGVILLVGVVMAVMDPLTIGQLLGDQSGWSGVVLASVVGAVTLIPGFVAFPTAALLLEGGAGLMQIAAFISSLMMVGIITIPVEVTYFGKQSTLLRNLLAFLFSFVVAMVIGRVVS